MSSLTPLSHPIYPITTTRDLLSQRTDRLVTTLHMLEMRNMRLSAESAALQDGVAAMSAAHDTLLQERNSLSAMLSELNRKVCVRHPVIIMRACHKDADLSAEPLAAIAEAGWAHLCHES